jgi:hypothetical protein
MSLEAIRLSIRLQRFEVFAIAAAALAAIAGTMWFVWRFDAIAVPVACFPSDEAEVFDPSCETLLRPFYQLVEDSRVALLGLAGLPFLGAAILGVPIVGRELERGTTRLAWSLAPSRRHWFGSRLLPILAVVAVVAVSLALGAERLFAARSPDMDMGASFDDYGFRGPLLAARAIALFAVAVTAGALLGRALPALLVGLAAFLAILVGVQAAHDAILEREVVYRPMEEYRPGDRNMIGALRLRDGSIVRWDQVDPVYLDDGRVLVDGELADMIQAIIPGERYAEVAGREAAAFGLIAIVLLGATAVIVDRRRPG